MTSRTILPLIESNGEAARGQGYRLVVKRYARKPIPSDVMEGLMRRFAEGPPWANELVAALACGEQPVEMPALLRLLEGGTVDQQRSAIAQLWHRQPAGPPDELNRLLRRVADGTGPVAFDAAHLLASRGDLGATNRLAAIIVANDGKPESLRHYASETLSSELRRSVDEILMTV